jgi:chromatin structure-remodeling complex subunit RSC1/2
MIKVRVISRALPALNFAPCHETTRSRLHGPNRSIVSSRRRLPTSPIMAPSPASESPTANPADGNLDMSENDDEKDELTESTVTNEEYETMHTVLSNIYGYRTDDGDDPSKMFHRKVNKRMVPDYYDVIKEPMAMSMIKAKINGREYKSFEEFVRDFALICHNAQVYNAPTAQAYQDALIIKEVFEEELARIVKNGIVSKDRTELPFLGDIPPPDELIVEEVEEEDDDEEDEEDEDEEDTEDEGKKKRKRGRPSLASKREKEGKEKDEDPDTRKKRGRPPRVDTPMEARIKAIMKGLRKPKSSNGDLMIVNFERLPDKALLPDYFREIKQPIALDVVKKKLKRKKYNSVEQFMRDVELMFENAKQYNQDESQIYKDAVTLQKEGRSLAEHEKSRPDTDFVMEDGRIPLTDGILHNGELWKVGKCSFNLLFSRY